MLQPIQHFLLAAGGVRVAPYLNEGTNDMRILIAAVAVATLAGCATSHVDIPNPRETQD